jgi:hypothetical protein
MFGGISKAGETNDVYLFDTRCNRWHKPTVVGNPPAERSGHAMNVVPSTLDTAAVATLNPSPKP